MSLKLDGKKLSLEIEERLTDYISSNKKIAKRAPGLAVIRIGEDPASGVYVNNKEKACSRIGIKSFIFHLKDSVEQKEVEQLIIKLNSDKDIDGMLLQLPIPKKFDEQKLISHINPSKDVDGLNEINITIEGKKIVVIGRSLLVGKPLSLMLLNLNGTVTMTHSKTLNLNKVCREADILIAAAGKPNLVDSSFVKEGAVIIDVGIHRLKSSDKNQTRLCGDVLLEDVISKVFAYTPVPGGVGPMTVTMLLVNTIFSWQKQFGLSSTLNDLLP